MGGMADIYTDDPSHLVLSGLVDQPERLGLEQLRVLGWREDGSDRVVVPLRPVIERARPSRAATHVTAASADGAYTASIPLPEALSKGELHLEARDAKAPIRLQVPGGMTLCWNVKGLGRLKVTDGPEPDSLPEVLTH